jgi:hypothetical protein
MQSVAFLGPAAALLVLANPSVSPSLALACLTAALGITSLGTVWHPRPMRSRLLICPSESRVTSIDRALSMHGGVAPKVMVH